MLSINVVLKGILSYIVFFKNKQLKFSEKFYALIAEKLADKQIGELC